MIKVREKDGPESAEGVLVMREIISARMNLNLFETDTILPELIQMSGGCLRDLFLLIREASNFTRDADRKKITQTDYEKALQVLTKDYQNTLTDEKIEGQYYPVEKFYESLVELDQTGKYENTVLMLKLRQTLCVLGYNGEFWCAVHPVVRQILVKKGLLNS